VDVGVVSIPVEMREASVTVRAGVQNLFNKAYQNHLATLRGAVLCEPGRNFYLSAGFAI
jgi:outer membrane receptor protein involved in Fe transport